LLEHASPLPAPPMHQRGRRMRRLWRSRASLVLQATLPSIASAEVVVGACQPRFFPPSYPGANITVHNGMSLQDVCFEGPGPFRVFVIGDWGGRGSPPKPVTVKKRPWVPVIDDTAQERVAAQMARRAVTANPDYLLNVGDNFYWSGAEVFCDKPQEWTSQWNGIFETVYAGPGLDGKQWLGVLGNHDYGGYRFDSGWPQTIAYTWAPPGRWMTPAQYWTVTVRYPGFSVDYYFVDSNVFDAGDPKADPEHNMCSLEHNHLGNCAVQGGPGSVWSCPVYFANLWTAQQHWLDRKLADSSADWQVVVTHFPPKWGRNDWEPLADKHGIDLFVSGHEHLQFVWGPEDPRNFLAPSAWIVSGGGGGIQSEVGVDAVSGNDDGYGFMELTLARDWLEIVAVSHGGHVRSTTRLRPRLPATSTTTMTTVTSTTSTSSTTTSTTTTTTLGLAAVLGEATPVVLPLLVGLSGAAAASFLIAHYRGPCRNYGALPPEPTGLINPSSAAGCGREERKLRLIVTLD